MPKGTSNDNTKTYKGRAGFVIKEVRVLQLPWRSCSGASNRRYAHIGDIIVAVIKEAVPNTPLQRSEVIRAVIVLTRKELKRDNGMII
ncbi:hypothetical protein J1N35_036741 [Gossypium stocksii]|uniref:Ribosomal protein L14 n=1 Tax=Gossypium stocksii TaxID=47602 RepID=A0A9D3UII3_9ROSI|nr:hypothetical protein J1N35_036741 [Gossypium stocksii]